MLKCIRCNSALVKKSYEGIQIDQCSKCNGTWLDQGELEQIINIREEQFTESQIKIAIINIFSGVTQKEKNSVELCIKCSNEMNPLNFAYDSGVIIDVCPDRHGIWLDGEELVRVQAQFEARELTVDQDRARLVAQIKKANHENVESNYLINRIIKAIKNAVF